MKMKKNGDLTTGSIPVQLLKLALPIMGTSFVQMAYNLTDMLWIGRVGSGAVAAVGTAGFFVWFGFAFIMMVKVGAEVGVSQSIGRKDFSGARDFARNSIILISFTALFYGLLLVLLRNPLISFFNLGDSQVISDALTYLVIVSAGTIFTFLNPVFSGIYNGTGNSLTPFFINSIGLGINMVLDPLMIFGYGGFPKLGVAGAAIATVISQAIVSIIFAIFMKSRFSPFSEFHFFRKPNILFMKRIFKFGYPAGTQSALFTIFAILIARIITRWGALPIAIQKVGAQIEAISWMTASGFSSALSAFTGQNYGAGKWERIWKGYFVTLAMSGFLGIVATYLFYFHSEAIFALFIPEAKAIEYGKVYLEILSYSQLFMCIEIVTAGAFSGLGRTLTPAVISITFTGARVPAAMILSSATLLGLNGVWWSISMSSVFKGVILVAAFLILLYKHPEIDTKKMISRIIYFRNNKFLRDKRCIGGKM